MRETIEQRAGEALRAEDLGPIIERQVGGFQNGVPFVYTLASSRAVPKNALWWIRDWEESGFPAIFLEAGPKSPGWGERFRQ